MQDKHYDYLIVGAGLFGSVCARELTNEGKLVLVIDKRNHIGGNCYTNTDHGVIVHKYGPHIFHTDDKRIWDYIAKKIKLQPAPNFTPIANYNGRVYNLPFNMNTFAQLFGITTPAEVMERIKRERAEIKEPRNLEEQAIALVGRTVYEHIIKEYSEKQWGRDCKDLPPELIKRLPVRFTYNNTYYNDKYIGIPSQGWTPLFEKLLLGIDTRLESDFLSNRAEYTQVASKIIYTGAIDEFFGHSLGRLDYRSLYFETEYHKGNYQGCAVMNYTDREHAYTRSIEHRHFDMTGRDYSDTVVTKEYPVPFEKDSIPYYPINNANNNALYGQYKKLAMEQDNIVFGGRLGSYTYADMDDTIANAITLVRQLLLN